MAGIFRRLLPLCTGRNQVAAATLQQACSRADSAAAVGTLCVLCGDRTASRHLHWSAGWRAPEAQTVDLREPAGALTIKDEDDSEDEESTRNMTPKEVVAQLDRNIIGQADAKRAVANALRNRWRRKQLATPMREEIVPKNILMIGPTGCGKTEIARRLAKLADAPFVKVEATKFTEVGFHGRDVDQIIRDLMDNAIALTKQNMRKRAARKIARSVEERIVRSLCGDGSSEQTMASFRDLYRKGALDDREIDVEVPLSNNITPGMDNAAGVGMMAQHIMVTLERMNTRRGAPTEKRRMKVSEARGIIEEAEAETVVNMDLVTKEAITAVEQDGIVFIDEIDKIVTSSDSRYGADASSEGVQRDLLPIVEGSTVQTKYGNINTDHILFICSGAFHACKPSDMLAELQGRLPIRVELKGLTANDFYRILTEPEHNMIRQQQALLDAEGLDLHFTDAAIREVARVAEEVNTAVDNIGARRLLTIIERILEDISFNAPELAAQSAAGGGPVTHMVDKDMVLSRVGELLKKQDLSKFIL